MNKKVSIIVVNWNGKYFLKKCLDSISRQKYQPYEVIVVDNASTDGSISYIRKFFPKIKVIPNKSNIGCAKAYNLGFSKAKGDYIVNLNNDTYSSDSLWLGKMVSDLEKDDAIAIVGSTHYTLKNLSYHKKHPNRVQTLNPLGYLVSHDYGKRVKDPFLVGGGALILKKKYFKYPLFPQEHYVSYGEDLALCWKTRLNNLKIVMSNAVLIHDCCGSYSKNRKTAIFHYEKNKLMNLLLFYESSSLIKLFPLMLMSSLIINTLHFKDIFIRFKSYCWLLFNYRIILQMRKKIQAKRKASDKDIFRFMSYKLVDEEDINNRLIRPITRIANKSVKVYYRLFNIKTLEFYP